MSKVLVCGRWLSLRLFPVFDRLASLDRPRFSHFPKNVMKEVITHNLKTFSVYFAIQSMFCHLFSLFTFDFNYVLSFPGSACYYSEVLARPPSSRILHSFLAFFLFRPTDRQTQNESKNAFDSKQKKVNGPRGSISKQDTINLVRRANRRAKPQGPRSNTL